MNGKRILTFLLALILLSSLCACGANPTQTPAEGPAVRPFTDSTGRTVEVPAHIEKVAVTGPMAQMVVFALCPDRMAGVATPWDTSAAAYLDSVYYDLPVLGQLYGGHSQLDPEILLQSGAQVVIDVGELKGAVAEDMDALQEQTGLPFVHVTATLDTMPEAYRLLGELLEMPAEAQILADYCQRVYSRGMAVAASANRPGILYITGENGLNVVAKDSYHAGLLDQLANNLAVVEEPSAKGTGNEVDMEQILLWNPDVIFFAPGSIYATVGEDPNWQTVSAIRNGTYYEVPVGPYNWMGFPPSVQRLLGMMWMETLLYPDAVDFDLKTEVQTYFDLFYHCQLTDAQYEALVANSIGK